MHSATLSGRAGPCAGRGEWRVSETIPRITVETVKVIQKKLKQIRVISSASSRLIPSLPNQPVMAQSMPSVATMAGLNASTRHSATPSS